MRAQVVTICDIKGGVGKTSATGCLAQLSALDGKKTLVIDLDSQNSLSFWFDAQDTGRTVYSIFLGDKAEDCIQSTSFGVDLIPGSESLILLKKGRESSRIIEKALEPLRSEYDIIYIDTGPTMSEALYNGIYAASEILIPLATDIMSIRGFLGIVDLVKEARKTRRNIHLAGAFLSDYDRRPIVNQELRNMLEEECKKNKVPYLGEVRRNIKLQEAQAACTPLYSYAPKCPAAQDYREIYKKLMNNLYNK